VNVPQVIRILLGNNKQGYALSEQAKITYIQEEIKHARRNEMFGYAIAFVSLLAFWFTEGLYQAVSGLVVIICLAVSVYHSYRGAKLRKQLRALAFG
jgi:hypothetical protein